MLSPYRASFAAKYDMSVVALEDDVEANITHFAHRAEFLTLLQAFLEALDQNDDKNLDDLVKPMGAIVGRLTRSIADGSSTNISHYLAY
jgi:hypothetical protein